MPRNEPQKSSRKSHRQNENASDSKSQTGVNSNADTEEPIISTDANGGTQGDHPSPVCTDAIDPALLAAIRHVIHEECEGLRADIKALNKRLNTFDKHVKDITTLKSTVTTVESGLQHASDRLDHIDDKVFPAVAQHVSAISQRLLHETLKMDAHRRKWNVVIHGINGPAGEEETATRSAVMDFARKALKLSPEDIRDTKFSACHRLSRKENAGIIIRFVDLTYRDKWLSGAKNIQSYIADLRPPNPDKKVSLAIDLPPRIRPLKDNLMKKRRELPAEKRRKSKLRYLSQWPFVELRVEGESPIRPAESLSDIANSTLGLNLKLQIPPLGNG